MPLHTHIEAKSMEPAKRLESLVQRIRVINEERIAGKERLAMLKKQYDAEVEKLKQKGINDVTDLPAKIAELNKQVEETLAQLEMQVSEAEAKLEG